MSLKFRNASFSPVTLITAERQKLFIAAKTFELPSCDQKLVGKSSVWETWANSAVAKASQLKTLEDVVKHSETFETAQHDQIQPQGSSEVMAAHL